MAVDKLVDSTQLDADLTSVANAIRTKGGTSASLAFPADFVSAIAAIPTGGGSGITKETVSYTTTGANYANAIPISGDVTKILFAHFYDNDAAYPTNNSVYEGMKIGPALAHFNATAEDKSWAFLRTTSAGVTGVSSYQGSHAFDQAGYVTVSSNPKIPSGHTIKLDVFYTS